MPATPEELLSQLAESPNHPYPREIIEAMIQRREEMIPALLAVIEDASQRPAHFSESGNWKPLTFAAYLLAQFRETRAFKPLCTTLALPAKVCDELWGDILCDDMGRILASVYDGDDQPLRAVMADRDVYEYVHGAAVPKFYECLRHAGKIEPAELEAYAEHLLTEGLERKPHYAWDGWAILCAEHGFSRLLPLLKMAMAEGLCDPMVFGFETLLKTTENGGDDRWIDSASLIDDTIAETEWWHTWAKSEPMPIFKVPPPPRPEPPQVVVTRFAPKIGRNDPCSCGSGKKYKKCCGAAA